MVDSVKISGNSFITEKTGNIKDYYKITSCIGRGILPLILCVTMFRGLR